MTPQAREIYKPVGPMAETWVDLGHGRETVHVEVEMGAAGHDRAFATCRQTDGRDYTWHIGDGDPDEIPAVVEAARRLGGSVRPQRGEPQEITLPNGRRVPGRFAPAACLGWEGMPETFKGMFYPLYEEFGTRFSIQVPWSPEQLRKLHRNMVETARFFGALERIGDE